MCDAGNFRFTHNLLAQFPSRELAHRLRGAQKSYPPTEGGKGSHWMEKGGEGCGVGVG